MDARQDHTAGAGMSDIAQPVPALPSKLFAQLASLAAVGVTATLLSALFATNVVGLVAIARVVAFGYAMLLNSEVATMLVAFLLVTNVPVVAVKFHSVPKVVGALLPALLILPLLDVLIRRRQAVVIPASL